ncbi:MAG: TonB-dependent receptor [Saprospiraceae bacterium]
MIKNLLLFTLLVFPIVLTAQYSGTYQKQSLSEILTDLETRYSVRFYYQNDKLPTTKISVQLDSLNARQLANQLTQNSPLSAVVFNKNTIIFAPQSELIKTYSNDYFVAKYQAAADLSPTVSTIKIGAADNLKTNGNAQIAGVVRDAATDELLVGATILLRDTDYSTVTDYDGKFNLEVPVGTYRAQMQSVGYQPIERVLQVFNDGEWEVELFTQIYELGEVIVTDKAQDENVQSAQVGVPPLSTQTIKELPAFMGEADVVKSLLTLPGVSTVGEGATGFNVRGGAIDQNLVMQDEGMIFNSSHALGFFSIFNPDAIREVTLYKGNIPAQFGGRLSSVLDVQTKDADFEEVKLNGGLGLFSSKMTVEMPLVKKKTSLLIGGRAAYPDWLLRQAENADVQRSSAFFYDFSGKITQRIGTQGSSISLAHYQSFDRFRFAEDFGFEWTNRVSTLQWRQILNLNNSIKVSAIRGGLGNRLFEPTGTEAFNLDSGLDYTKGKINLLSTAILNHEINAGVEGVLYESQPERLQQRGDESEISPLEIAKDRGLESAIYINDEWEISERLALSVGLRYSNFQQLAEENVITYQDGLPLSPNTAIDSTFINSGSVQSYGGIEPRLSLRYSIDQDKSIKLSYNRARQYIHLISNTTAATPVDVWQVSTQYIPPQIADNFSVGYFQNVDDNLWETSFEIYYRNLPQLIEYKDFARLLLNEHLETELLIGKGWAAGSEFSVTKTRGKMKGRLSYTFARSFRTVAGDSRVEVINGGDRFPANFDQPHHLKLNAQFELSRKATFNVNFVYHTGRPITVPTAAYQVNGKTIADYSLRNQFRIPDYHRLDIAYTLVPRAIRKGRYQGSWTLSVYNVYGRDNAFSVFFRRGDLGQPQAFKLAILGAIFPAITYNLSIQ